MSSDYPDIDLNVLTMERACAIIQDNTQDEGGPMMSVEQIRGEIIIPRLLVELELTDAKELPSAQELAEDTDLRERYLDALFEITLHDSGITYNKLKRFLNELGQATDQHINEQHRILAERYVKPDDWRNRQVHDLARDEQDANNHNQGFVVK